MNTIKILPTTIILTNGDELYELTSEDEKSLKHIEIESKDNSTINIDLTEISYETVAFVNNSNIGKSTLEWLSNVDDSKILAVEDRTITCDESLKTKYILVLSKLVAKGYSISIPTIVTNMSVLGYEEITAEGDYNYILSYEPNDAIHNFAWEITSDPVPEGVTLETSDETHATLHVEGSVNDYINITVTDSYSGKSVVETVYISTAVDYTGLCFTANTANSTIAQNIGKEGCTYYTSTNGSTWNEYTLGTTITLENAGDKVYWKGNGLSNNTGSTSKLTTPVFVMSGSIQASGSVMSLIGDENSLIITEGNDFAGLFKSCNSLTNAPELPATTLTDYCYQEMFYNCNKLTSAPELPAKNLTPYCYLTMFAGCYNMVNAPVLASTSLAKGCYFRMLMNTGITTMPDLFAFTLADYCYAYMFYGCSKLTTVSNLPAVTMSSHCYDNMFRNCSSLVTAPTMPSWPNLAEYCCRGMFRVCESLVNVSDLNPNSMASHCYEDMFRSCTSLIKSPLAADIRMYTATGCCSNMFNRCTKLTTMNNSGNTFDIGGLSSDCFLGMFANCTSLSGDAELQCNGNDPDSWCFYQMFYGCTSLKSCTFSSLSTQSSTFPTNWAYQMFYNCSSLDTIKYGNTNSPTWNNDYSSDWLYGTAANGTFYKYAWVTVPQTGPSNIPTDWTVAAYF